MTLDEIMSQIEEANSILILSHENPDGDALGSSLAMYNFLKSIGKDVEVVMHKYPANFSYLPGIEEIKTEPSREIFDMSIAMDCPDTHRIADYIDWFENAKVKVSIDHHNKNTMFADFNYVNPVAPACCEIVVGVFKYLNIEFTKDIIKCLLTGIITDTNGFRNAGITADTFDFAAKALEEGVNVSKIYRQALMTMTKTRFEVQKLVSERLEFYEDGKITFTYINKEDDEKIGIKTGDHEGMVEIGRDIEGVEISIFASEREEGLYKVSFRANDYVDVSDICLMFGGGGHIRAAGCFVQGTLETVREKVLQESKKHLK